MGTGAADAANKSADTTVPTMVAGDALFAVVTPRAWHTCGLSTTGNALCWGGDMFHMKSPAPARVQLPDQVLTSTTGTFHDCALTRGGIAYCWGTDTDGELGDGTTHDALSSAQPQSTARMLAIQGS